MVILFTEVQICMGEFPIHPPTQKPFLPPTHQYIQKRQAAITLNLHCELYVFMVPIQKAQTSAIQMYNAAKPKGYHLFNYGKRGV